jgi:phosphoheptose isomerase
VEFDVYNTVVLGCRCKFCCALKGCVCESGRISARRVCNAVQCARARGTFTVRMTGEGEGKHRVSLAEACLRVASRETARIQECHSIFG